MKGQWVALEGIDGVGKTAVFYALMRRWYGKNFIGIPDERLPHILVKKHIVMVRDIAWAGYYDDAKQWVRYFLGRQHRDKYAHEWPESGKWVISDRSWLSNICYHDEAYTQPLLELESALRLPDIIVWFDGPRRITKSDDPHRSVLIAAEENYKRWYKNQGTLPHGRILHLEIQSDETLKETTEKVETLLRELHFPIPTEKGDSRV